MSILSIFLSAPDKSELEKALVLSFDVFNTVLGRKSTSASARFRIAFDRLNSNEETTRKLVRLRLAGEIEAMHRHGADLYSMDDIYREMEQIKAATVGPLDQAKQAEFKMEREQCFVIAGARWLLEEARKESAQIIFATDMYLPPEFIQELLEKNGLWAKGDRLFVSHVEGAAKHGNLFFKICRELSVRPDQILHIGDSWRADVLRPRQLGIRSIYFPDAQASRYETELSGAGLECLADCVRKVRLQNPYTEDAFRKTIWSTACGVAAPLFLGYVLWLGARVLPMRLERLYFISRDGLIFKKLYDLFWSSRPGMPAARYLYGSRQAWGVIRAVRLAEEDIRFLTAAIPSLSFRQFLQRCGIENPEGEIPASFLPRPLWDSALSPAELARLRAQLKEGRLRTFVSEGAKIKAGEARAYLTQEGLGHGSYGLVDLGWFGNLQEYLKGIFPWQPPRHGFYLDLRLNPKILTDKEASVYLHRLPLFGFNETTSIHLLEMLATAPHGTTVGYQTSGGRWIPREDPSTVLYASAEVIQIQHEAILGVAKEFRELCRPDPIDGGLQIREPAVSNFVKILLNPTIAEAEWLGRCRFTSRQEGGRGAEIGPQIGWVRSLRLLWEGFRREEAFWPQASMQRAKPVPRAILKLRHGITQTKACLDRLCQRVS